MKSEIEIEKFRQRLRLAEQEIAELKSEIQEPTEDWEDSWYDSGC